MKIGAKICLQLSFLYRQHEQYSVFHNSVQFTKVIDPFIPSLRHFRQFLAGEISSVSIYTQQKLKPPSTKISQTFVLSSFICAQRAE